MVCQANPRCAYAIDAASFRTTLMALDCHATHLMPFFILVSDKHDSGELPIPDRFLAVLESLLRSREVQGQPR